MDFTDVVDVLEEEYQQVILLLSIHHPVVNHPNKLLDEEIPAIHSPATIQAKMAGYSCPLWTPHGFPKAAYLVFSSFN